MFRWRLPVATLLIVALVALGYLDHHAAVPCVWLAPALVVFVALATHELLRLCNRVGLKPPAALAYCGTVLVALSPCAALLARGGNIASSGNCPSPSGSSLLLAYGSAWTLVALVACVMTALVAEMVRYQTPGRSTANLAACLAVINYLGLTLSFAVELRLRWGVGALASAILVAKMADTGAYAAGKSLGRHPLATRLSPSKTWEGVLGAFALGLVASWVAFQYLVPTHSPAPVPSPASFPYGWAIYGLLITGAGVVGDLAESLLKRDAQCKDSSTWIPGLGGVLDMLDSVLFAAPVAYLSWQFGLVQLP